MQLAVCFIALSFLLASAKEDPDLALSPIYCAYEYNKHGGEEGKPLAADGEILPDNKTIQCGPERSLSCFAFWMIDSRKPDGIIVVKKGCWIDSEQGSCRDNGEVCQAGEASLNNSRFCCCTGHMCNVNVSDVHYANTTLSPDPPPGTRYLMGSKYKIETIIKALVPLCVLGLIVVILFVTWRLWMNSRALSRQQSHWMEAPPAPQIDVSSLKLGDTIRKGRYSEVLKGTLNNREVVIKKFIHRQYYNNERNIYMLPFMEHDSILQFYTAVERLSEEEGRMNYILVLEYMSHGSLKGYLKNSAIDWSTLCGMSYSIAKGLAHLHSEIKRGNVAKPVIAHRDINTANILVKNDLTCVISDFGFSMTTIGSKIFRNGHCENAEQFSLTDVGTISYMAPEVLEGAMNLRDCEASLKQVDIYALGLVLWEVASRCTDLYQGLPVPEHMIPYQAEAGLHPTFEDIQMIVYHNKTRPKFPDVWKDTNQAVRALKETIEDCWDSDAEARLTALCVEERLAEMAVLWANDIRHKGVTPTLNTTSQDSIGEKHESPTLIIPISPVSPAPPVIMQGELSPSEPTENSSAPLLTRHPPGTENLDTSNTTRQSWLNERSISSSTTETTILSPSESDPPAKPQNINLAKSNLASQQNHGRNPMVERNTHKSSDEELTVSGNTLVSSKTSKTTKPETATGNVRAQRPSNQLMDNGFDNLQDNVESSLVQNDHLSPHRNRPIAYQQNPVHSEPVPTRPVSANTTPSQLIITSNKTNNNEHKHKSLFSKLKPREIGLKLSHLAFGKHSKPVSQNDTKVQNKRCKPAVNLTGMSGPQQDLRDPRPTEVCILNGVPVVRPTSLTMSNGSVVNKDNSRLAEHRLAIAEVGIAKLHSANGGLPSVVHMRNDRGLSRSSSDLSPSNLSDNERWEETNLMSSSGQVNKRPSTLPLDSQGSSCSTSASLLNAWQDGTTQHSQDASLSSSAELTPGEKIKRRIKTPVGAKRGRFSLYSDRMMFSQSCDDIGNQPNPTGPRLNKASISLHQFSSSDVERHWQGSAAV